MGLLSLVFIEFISIYLFYFPLFFFLFLAKFFFLSTIQYGIGI
jgi:hypothetical protein